MRLSAVRLSILIGCLWSLHAGAAPKVEHPHQLQLKEERLLMDTLGHIRNHHLDAALQSIETLVELNPKFHLAQLVYGDLLLAKSQPIGEFGNLSLKTRGRINELRDEARSRLRSHLSQPQQGTLPANMLRLSADQKRVIVVDLEMSRLYLFENDNGTPRLLANYYASIGKNGTAKQVEGDLKTPIGVYFISRHIPGSELPDLYGAGALPIDYPNPWDHRLGRTGYGIWIHGVPSDTYSRAPRSSEGCVALANADFESLIPLIDIGKTPVILADRVDWQPPSHIEQQRKEIEEAIEKWRRDWESRNIAQYAANYSPSFKAENRDYESWVARKETINRGKTQINIRLTGLSIFSDPGEEGLAVVRFSQRYESNNYSGGAYKRQYWKREGDGVWRIVYEGTEKTNTPPLARNQ
ncbi:MAG: L,D-transpeptidase family protein [Candidatus Polarisedimenticolaceae bacterium]|nr:L,D-transpeptidase family protein [Candidatus Polarisedimenticolaceae bacterium]